MHSHLPSLQWIKSQANIMEKLVEKWSCINSWSDNITGLQEMHAVLVQDFGRLQGDVESVVLPRQHIIDKKGKGVERHLGNAIRIRKRKEASLQVLLAGHMDTVYPPSQSFSVFKQEEILFGPGVTDMKGGLAILLIALEALERSPFAFSIGWEVLINPDEEIGSPGSFFLFKEAAKRNHIGLIFEPSFSDGSFVSQRKGSANYTVLVKGRSAHAGRDFHEGKSAVYALVHFIHELERISAPLNGTINVGFMEGGGILNIVPDQALCQFNVRAKEASEMKRIHMEIEHLIKTVQQRDGIQMTLVLDTQRLPKPFDIKSQALFKAFRSCADELDLPFQLKESGGVCDGNLLSAEGLPTIDSIGAIGGKIHTNEEYLLLPSLVQRAQLVALFLLHVASGKLSLPQHIS